MKEPWDITYEVKKGPPAMPWPTYAELSTGEYTSLLEGLPSEYEVQQFFERNPSFVPGALTPGDDSGHWPHPAALISQPELAGVGKRSPDFMWIATDSGAWYPTFIEIERPNKAIFKGSKVEPNADFWQARNQLNQWRSWLDSAANQDVFTERYGVPDRMRGRKMVPHLILVYGRRAEFERDRQKTSLRANLVNGPDERLVSYDRIQPRYDYRYFLTVRAAASGRFRAVAVPPTFGLGPAIADELLLIDGLEEAIANDNVLDRDRKEFLIERTAYWRRWASGDGSKASQHGICE